MNTIQVSDSNREHLLGRVVLVKYSLEEENIAMVVKWKPETGDILLVYPKELDAEWVHISSYQYRLIPMHSSSTYNIEDV